MLELMSFWFALMQSRVLASMKSSNLQFLAGEEKKDRFFFRGFWSFLSCRDTLLGNEWKKGKLIYSCKRIHPSSGFWEILVSG